MYNFKEVEQSILDFWQEKKIFEKLRKRNAKGKNFYFLQGPPYTSGRLHIGHAWNNSLKDIVLRYKRMCGFNVWDRAGYDMHGLPTENAVQKKLGIKDKQEIEKYGVEKFIRECIKFSSENAKQMDKDLARLGVWMDFENAYWPIKTEFIEGEWWLIKRAWEQKRLYKGKKIMHWCENCETSLAKHELEYENVKENSIFLKFKIKNKDEYLIIWTTTPWTIPFNLAVMANPAVNYAKAEVETKKGKESWIVAKDLANSLISSLLGMKFKIVEEFKGDKLKGLEYVHPLHSKLKDIYDELKKKWKNAHTVILSEKYVDTSAGSGLVHCAPGCGPEDYEAGREYGLNSFNLINEKGYFEGMGEFSGLRAKQDDAKFVEALKEAGSLVAETQIEHEYAHCWRCRKPIVFRATEQWFMKIEDLIPKLLDFNKKIRWQPKFTSKNYDLWIENLKDNGITRQRYWGCPAPIWQCSCGNTEVIGSVEELKKKAGKIPEDMHKPWIDKVKLKCSKCGGEMARIPDIIDVWVDSGTASWNCLHYPSTDRYFKELWPADFILEATEQIKLWFSMLQICSAIAFGKSCYKNVYCHGMILDYQGMKMSKSLGNIISPYEVVDKYGADILRYYMCEIRAGENINFNWDDVKIKQRNMNILCNVSNFIKELERQAAPDKKFGIEEKYILSRKNASIKKVTELIEEYRIDEVIKEIENLFLDLSRVYIQHTREKASSKDAGKVLYAVNDVYIDTLKMFSSVCPFITESIWQDLRNRKIVKEESIHLCLWPEHNEKMIDKKLEEDFSHALKIIEAGMAERDSAKIGLKWPLAKASIETDKKLSKELQDIIARQLNVKKIEMNIGEKNKIIKVQLDTKLTAELEAEGYAREIARAVQAERKKAGLVKTDVIELLIVVDNHLLSMLKPQEKFIKERTNAKAFEITAQAAAGAGKKKYPVESEFSVKDKKIKVMFGKA
ncbi:MAG TPA: isoleucine--tRNA ligase [Candidatus Nanoarchaeia archaeon]|nr:isoleucine--tRNA ligase [Candidatus Nanoarchaeia archaeon]